MYYMSAFSQHISGIFKTGSYIRDIFDMFMCVLNFCYIYISHFCLCCPVIFLNDIFYVFIKKDLGNYILIRHNENHKMYELY